MESVLNYCIELMQWIPKEVILTIVIVVLLTEATKSGLKSLEDYLEEKKGKQIKFFDHTKIIFVSVWSIIGSVVLTVARIITWQMFPLYLFAIFGAAVGMYEYIIKKVNKLWE